MSTTTASYQRHYPNPSSLYPLVEDITELEYSCFACDDNNNLLDRFPLRERAFPVTQPLDLEGDSAERKGHRRISSGSSFKRRSSRSLSSFDDEMTAKTEQEEVKFQDAFVLTRQIFACTQSQVWECVHKVSGLRRCVKIIDLDILTPAEIEACRREVFFFQKVQGHEAIVKLIDVFDNNKTYVVMELAPGGNLLSRVIQQEALPEETVRRIAVTILKAIKHLRTFNLCHNDLQPSNLVLNGNDDVALIDFGRACACGEELDQGALHTSYSSPETIQLNTCTPVSDVWSLGAIVYFCFFGQAPIPYSKRRCELTFPYNESVSRQAKQFMIACLHHDPTVRLTAEEALAHPWLQQEQERKSNFSVKKWWKRWFGKKEQQPHEMLTPSSTGSSDIGLSPLSFSWRHN